MKIHHYTEVTAVEEIPGIKMHIVAGPQEGAKNFIMRVFEIESGASTPYHEHSWEHEMYILEGSAAIRNSDSEVLLKPGHSIFIPSGEKHCIVNKGQGIVRLICVIPNIDNLSSCFSNKQG